MRIIFLDIDGVLKPGASTDFKKDPTPWLGFQKLSCHLLEELCFQVKAKLVISSNWRTEFTRGSMGDALGRLKYFLFDHEQEWRTDSDGPTRMDEIMRWLCDRADIDSFIILDDLPSVTFKHLHTRVVNTHPLRGFLHNEYQLAYLLLTN